MRRTLGIGLALALLAPVSGAYALGVTVEAGASFDLGDGRLGLGCSDLVVAGTFLAGSVGVDGARDVSIAPGGVLDVEASTLSVAGDWDNAGGLVPGTGAVRFEDGCGRTTATITGNSTFTELALTTSSGKVYAFGSGSTTTVTNSLTLAGAPGNLLAIRATVSGSEAFLDSQGSANGFYVDVQDNQAIGNPIELGVGSVLSGNTPGWVLAAVGLPSLQLLGLGLLLLVLLWSGRRAAAGKLL